MNSISTIRAKLKVTQQALADALQVSQGNISHYERGQGVPPEVAKRLIAFAALRGCHLTFDEIYGHLDRADLESRHVAPSVLPTGHGGRQPASPCNILDTVPDGSVVTTIPSS